MNPLLRGFIIANGIALILGVIAFSLFSDPVFLCDLQQQAGEAAVCHPNQAIAMGIFIYLLTIAVFLLILLASGVGWAVGGVLRKTWDMLCSLAAPHS